MKHAAKSSPWALAWNRIQSEMSSLLSVILLAGIVRAAMKETHTFARTVQSLAYIQTVPLDHILSYQQ
jgi:amino acid permease